MVMEMPSLKLQLSSLLLGGEVKECSIMFIVS